MNNGKSEAIKQWLMRYREAVRDSESLDARVTNARARAEAARASRLDGMPHGGGFAGDTVGVALARIDELEREAQEARAHALKLYREIDAAIKEISVPGWPDQRAVLQVRYLDCEPWEGVSEVLFGGRTDYEGKEDTYLRRCHKLHGAALAALAELVPLDVGQENTHRKDDKK